MRGTPVVVVTIMVVLLELVSGPRGALAQSSESAARAAARKLGYQGVEAFQAGQFAAASDKLEKAYAVLKVPSLGIWSARALVKLDKLVEATDRYLEIARLPLGGGDQEVQKKAQNDAQAELEATQAQTPTLSIRVQGADQAAVQVKIDGALVPPQLLGEASPLNPGEHAIEASSRDKRAATRVVLAPGEQKQVELQLAELGPSQSNTSTRDEAAHAPSLSTGASRPNRTAPSARRLAGWVTLSAGGAGLVVGGITGAMAMSKRTALDEDPSCADDKICPRGYADRVDSLNGMRTVSTVGFIVGGVLVATGVVLVLTAPQSGPLEHTALWISPSSLGLTRQF